MLRSYLEFLKSSSKHKLEQFTRISLYIVNFLVILVKKENALDYLMFIPVRQKGIIRSKNVRSNRKLNSHNRKPSQGGGRWVYGSLTE